MLNAGDRKRGRSLPEMESAEARLEVFLLCQVGRRLVLSKDSTVVTDELSLSVQPSLRQKRGPPC